MIISTRHNVQLDNEEKLQNIGKMIETLENLFNEKKKKIKILKENLSKHYFKYINKRFYTRDGSSYVIFTPHLKYKRNNIEEYNILLKKIRKENTYLSFSTTNIYNMPLHVIRDESKNDLIKLKNLTTIDGYEDHLSCFKKFSKDVRSIKTSFCDEVVDIHDKIEECRESIKKEIKPFLDKYSKITFLFSNSRKVDYIFVRTATRTNATRIIENEIKYRFPDFYTTISKSSLLKLKDCNLEINDKDLKELFLNLKSSIRIEKRITKFSYK